MSEIRGGKIKKDDLPTGRRIIRSSPLQLTCETSTSSKNAASLRVGLLIRIMMKENRPVTVSDLLVRAQARLESRSRGRI